MLWNQVMEELLRVADERGGVIGGLTFGVQLPGGAHAFPSRYLDTQLPITSLSCYTCFEVNFAGCLSSKVAGSSNCLVVSTHAFKPVLGPVQPHMAAASRRQRQRRPDGVEAVLRGCAGAAASPDAVQGLPGARKGCQGAECVDPVHAAQPGWPAPAHLSSGVRKSFKPLVL